MSGTHPHRSILIFMLFYLSTPQTNQTFPSNNDNTNTADPSTNNNQQNTNNFDNFNNNQQNNLDQFTQGITDFAPGGSTSGSGGWSTGGFTNGNNAGSSASGASLGTGFGSSFGQFDTSSDAASAAFASAYSFTILPTASYLDVNGSYLNQASPQACLANCQSCQILSNICQQCYSPYFQKTQQGSCQFNQAQYTLQSSPNQIRQGLAFQLAAQSWSNTREVNCTSTSFQLITVQRINQGQIMRYDRSLSLHQYIVVRFQLISLGWNGNEAGFSMTVNNQNNAQIVPTVNVPYLPNIPKQSLCSVTAADQRLSVTIKITDINTTLLSLSMTSYGGSFALSTFALITGQCHSSCATCAYSTSPTSCLTCNYFLITMTDGSCSSCPSGFNFTTTTDYTYCKKCPIAYQSCTNALTMCYYPQLNATVDGLCRVDYQGSFYGDYIQLDQQVFGSSVWTVGGLPAPSQYIPCGDRPLSRYTYVGLAQPYQPITRIFPTLLPHLSISLSFNVFIIDASYSSRNTKFQIYFDSQLVQVRYLLLQGLSDVCQSPLLQSFITFPPTQFFAHTSSSLNLTIVSDTIWGIRNARTVYMICDENCLKCGEGGCLRCRGVLVVGEGGRCDRCPGGYGRNFSQDGAGGVVQGEGCYKCGENCQECSVGSGKGSKSVCSICTAPFFLFEGVCTLKTNIGNVVTPPTPTVRGASPVNSTGGNSTGTTQCTLQLPSQSQDTPSLTNFTVSSSTLQTNIPTSTQQHYQYIVQFYLMKIGQWSPQDQIDVYLNDLRVLSKNYTQFGSQLCSPVQSNQTDYLTFQSLTLTDSNNSLSIYFELVTPNSTNTGTNKSFGVANIRVYPVGCSSCLFYPFTHKIQYNYDQYLNVVVSFSRVYRQSDQNLFKKIFVLLLNDEPIDYQIINNNSVIYTLQAHPPSDTILVSLALDVRYPQLVVTNINDPVNTQDPFFTTAYSGNNNSAIFYNYNNNSGNTQRYDNFKIIDSNTANTTLTRYTPVEHPNTINGIRTFFQIVSRIVIYLGFALFFLGLQTICTHCMHNLQKIWLHLFLAALAAPALLRQVLTGFREVQNQNIAINPTQWEEPLPQELYYDSRSYFYEYYTDVNFFRNIYNIGVAFAILMLYLLIMHFIAKRISRERSEQSSIMRHIKVTFHRRPYFYFNSVIFYQYLTLMLACFLQFTSLMNKTDQGAFGGISAAAAIVAFIFGTVYPIFHLFFLRHKQQYLGRAFRYHFANRYHQIFFRFVRRDIWADAQINYAQRLYNVYRFGQLWWYCLVVTILAYSPQAQLYLLMITQALHLFIMLMTKLSRNVFYRICKVIQLALFIGIQIILLVCQSEKQTLTQRSYNTLGGVAIGLIFGIILLSFLRAVYNGFLLRKEYKYKGLMDKKHVRQGQVMRRDFCYDSDEELEGVAAIPGTERYY